MLFSLKNENVEGIKNLFDDVDLPVQSNKDLDYEDRENLKNGVFETSISLVSIIMGGGVVSVPFAYTNVGFEVGILIQIFVVSSMFYSCKLYLEIRRILRCESSFTAVAQ